MPVLYQKRSPGLRILPWSHGESVSVWMWRWCNYTPKSCFFVACKPERIRGHRTKGWPRPFVSWRRENITCLFSPSLWHGQVLEAFKAVSVSRAQRTTNQRQKSWRDSTLLWPRRCFTCLIYLCRQAHVRIKHTTFGGSLCLSLVIKLKLLLLLTEKIKWTYNECCVLS